MAIQNDHVISVKKRGFLKQDDIRICICYGKIPQYFRPRTISYNFADRITGSHDVLAGVFMYRLREKARHEIADYRYIARYRIAISENSGSNDDLQPA